MKSRLPLASLRLALILVGAVMASPAAALSQGPQVGQDTVVATDGFTSDASNPYLAFSVDARSGASGENATGTISYFFGTPGYNESVESGIVTCLAVSGTGAVVGGYGLRRQGGYVFGGGPPYMPPPRAPYGFHLIVADNGPPGPPPNAGPDQADLVLAGPAAPTTCVGVSASRLGPAYGDIVVRDAHALPTSKNQCKSGGWAQFGFKNQGRCIRFVRLIPGPPPYPTTKEECRHGGWAQYGFKNKSKCVRFVRLTPNP
jgi:hypothetical protein